jgi:hypothetical protein
MTETISFRDPTLMVKYRGPRLTMAWGAIIGAVERRNDTAKPRGRAAAWPAAGYWNCAWAGKKEEHSKFIYIHFFDNFINRKFISLQIFIWQDNWSTKNCLSREKTSVFPRLCTEAKEYKR